MTESEQDEGMTTGKKVVAGAAIGVAVPAAVTVAKKLLGNGDDGEQQRPGQGRQQSSGGSRRSAGSRAGSTTRRTTSRAKGRASSARSSASKRSGSAQRKARSTAKRTSSTAPRGSGRTKEQLYNQAKRLGIEGRSSMTKAQLERAIARKRS